MSWDSAPKKDKKRDTKKIASKKEDLMPIAFKKKKKLGGDFDDSDDFGESDYFPDIKKLKKDAGQDFDWDKVYDNKKKKKTSKKAESPKVEERKKKKTSKKESSRHREEAPKKLSKKAPSKKYHDFGEDDDFDGGFAQVSTRTYTAAGNERCPGGRCSRGGGFASFNSSGRGMISQALKGKAMPA